jgi:hypothetical protein
MTLAIVLLGAVSFYGMNSSKSSQTSATTAVVTEASIRTYPSLVCEVKISGQIVGSIIVAPMSFSSDLIIPPFLYKYPTNHVRYSVEWQNKTRIDYDKFPIPSGTYFYGYDGQISITVNSVDKPAIFELWDNHRLYQYNATLSLMGFQPQFYDTGTSNRGLTHIEYARFWNPNSFPITISYYISEQGLYQYGNMTSLTTCP